MHALGSMHATRDPSSFWILVVEDDELFRYVTVKELTAHGYRVLQAANATEGLTVAREHSAPSLDLLIVDLNGNELIRVLKLTHPELQVLIVTGARAEDCPSHLKALTVDVLEKPVQFRALVARVKVILGA